MKTTQEAEAEVKTAIENLYRVFGRYPLAKHVEGCPCCVKNRDKRALASTSLRQLPSEKLLRFAFKAITTWGDQNDFKHFLPRILELVLSSDRIRCDEEVVLGKLGLAKWKSWAEDEQSSVQAYFRAGWYVILSKTEPPVEPDTWLCAMARSGEALTPYLNDWRDFRANAAYQHLLAFIDLNQAPYIKRHSLWNAFWPDSPAGVAQVCNWLSNPNTREQLEAIYFANEAAEYAPTLAEVIERLELIAQQ